MADLMKALSPRKRRFVEAYCGEGKFIGARAARIAGFAEKSARQRACELMKEPEVKTAIQERMTELTMTSGEVLVRLTEIARNEASEFIKAEGARLNLEAIQDAGKLHLIKAIKHTEAGTNIEILDPQFALELLAKHHGLLLERHEVEIRDAAVADTLDRKLAGLAASFGEAGVSGEPDGEGKD